MYKTNRHKMTKKLSKKQRCLLLQVMSLMTVIGIGATALITKFQSTRADTQAEVVTDSTASFINSVAGTASQIGQTYDLYASVLIAQAILESNSGQSELASAPYYNLFGIKGDYNGNSVTMKTWEDDGSGNTYQIDAAFRAYGSYAESLYDYAAVLSSSAYAGVWKSNTSSYQDATAALTGLYATDSNYAAKLNNIIATYNLTAYDTASAETSSATTSGTVWNSHRGTYTDAATLAEDEAWAAQAQ